MARARSTLEAPLALGEALARGCLALLLRGRCPLREAFARREAAARRRHVGGDIGQRAVRGWPVQGGRGEEACDLQRRSLHFAGDQRRDHVEEAPQ